MGCCYSEPDGSDIGQRQDTATVYHEIKPVIIPTYTNIIRNPSIRLPPVAEEITPTVVVKPSAPPATPRPSAPLITNPIVREEVPHKQDTDLQSLLTPVHAQKKKKNRR